MADKRKKKSTTRKQNKRKNKVKDDGHCRQHDDRSQVMVPCDTCQEWFHPVDLQSAVKHNHCNACQAKPTDPSPIQTIHEKDMVKKTSKKRALSVSFCKQSKLPKPEPIPVDQQWMDSKKTTTQDDDDDEDEDLDDLCPICEFDCTCGSSTTPTVSAPSIILNNQQQLVKDNGLHLEKEDIGDHQISDKIEHDSNDEDLGVLTKDDFSDSNDDAQSMEEDDSGERSSSSDLEEDEEHTYYLQSNGLWATSEDEEYDDNDDDDDVDNDNDNDVTTLRPTLTDRTARYSDQCEFKQPFNIATFDLGSNAAAYLNSAPTSPINQRMDDFYFRRLSLPSSTINHDTEWNDLTMLPIDTPTPQDTYSMTLSSPPKFALSLPPSPPPAAPLVISSSTPVSPSPSSSSSTRTTKYDLASLLPTNMKIPDQLLEMIKASLNEEVPSSTVEGSTQDMIPIEELLDLSKLETRPDLAGHVPRDLSRWERVPIGAFRLMRSKNRRWLNR